MRRRLALVLAVGAILLLPNWARAQELLTNGGIELVAEIFAGRDSVPPGWQMQEGPLVPELPPGPALPGTPFNVLGPYDGDYNNSGVTSLPCQPTGCGAVDAADYTVWRDHLGQAFPLPNRYRAITGNVSQSDYTAWKNNFGKPLPLSMAEPGNFEHLLLEGEWHMWFQPYNSSRTQNAEAIASNFAHLTQTVAGTPGLLYTMKGSALFEAHFAGGRTNLNLAGSSDTPPDDGLPSPTDSFLALDFLDATNAVLLGSVEIELMAAGQLNNTMWKEHTLSAVAPAGTTSVRVRASMINGVINPDVNPQSFFVDQFSLTAAAGSGAGSAVPEPASIYLGAFAVGALVALRPRSGLRRLERANR